jgi:outer membrane receptor protein involved in Fe transport
MTNLSKFDFNRLTTLTLLALLPAPVIGQTLDEIVVIGTTPLAGSGQEFRKIPFNAQTVSADDLSRSLSLDITDQLNANLASVSLNAAQNNPLQPDLQYRGFTASPLLGLPQGVAVYQDGVRINEPLGDAVNWDMLPESAISSLTLLSGANPVFGLNALGGAINVQMKNGFNYSDTEAELYTGDWDRKVGNIESGGNNGTWGYYANLSYFEEDGWRNFSNSDNLNFYGSVSWRDGVQSALDLVLQDGESDLRGNGAAPVGLLDLDHSGVFTSPDITRNDLTMLSLSGSHRFSDNIQFSGTAYHRANETFSFNGDASEFELCEFPGGSQALLEEPDEVEDLLDDELGIMLDEICEGGVPGITNFEELEDLIADQALLAGLDPEDFELEDISGELSGTGLLTDEGINNSSDRKQTSQGLEGQLTLLNDVAGLSNQLIVGYSYFNGESEFASITELTEMNSLTRSTEGLGVGTFIDEAATDIDTETQTWGLYFSNTLDISDAVALTVSGRFNESDVTLRDQSGQRPELNGDHRFSRFNPAIGFTYQLNESANLFVSYNEANRVPTPIELSCNDFIFTTAQQIALANGEDPDDVEFECRLPNAFLADPPLDDVVTRNVEVGVRGNFSGLNYNVGLFTAANEDDIIFQTTGRATGLFANVDETRRRGFESSLKGMRDNLEWFVSYSYIDATFEDDFLALSPNHAFADEEGNIAVSAGDRMPGIPQHHFKLGATYQVNQRLMIGADAFYNSKQYIRGDESNQLDEVDGYNVANLRAIYQVNDNFSLFARITNVFDTEYENFGLLGEDPSELIDFISDSSPIFLGAGAPRGAWFGARFSF